MAKPLETIDGQTLMNTPMESPRFVVSSLVPTGLHILGGAPKIGKSWLMLWLCLCVSKGEPLWGFECKQGTVLYLCLEDSYERIQSRLLELTEDAPACLHFSIMASRLSDGLPGQVDAFLAEHPDTSLIVIDTLQNIRTEMGNANPYASDYRELNVLREMALRHRIAILCVHHLRKMKDDDPMNMLSGTTGLSGAVDTVFILDREKRTDSRATLYCTGRDIESRELRLELDGQVWRMCGENEPVPLLDSSVAAVCEYLLSLSADFSGTATQLSTEIEQATGKSITPAVLRKKLMSCHGELTERGWDCTFRRTRTEKIIEIRRRDSCATASE